MAFFHWKMDPFLKDVFQQTFTVNRTRSSAYLNNHGIIQMLEQFVISWSNKFPHLPSWRVGRSGQQMAKLRLRVAILSRVIAIKILFIDLDNNVVSRSSQTRRRSFLKLYKIRLFVWAVVMTGFVGWPVRIRVRHPGLIRHAQENLFAMGHRFNCDAMSEGWTGKFLSEQDSLRWPADWAEQSKSNKAASFQLHFKFAPPFKRLKRQRVVEVFQF